MDRESLVLRNRAMAEVFHATAPKHYIRRVMLRSLSQIPISKQKYRNLQRILLVRPDHLGDILLSTPAIKALRRATPNAEIHALVGPWSANVLANYTELDAVLTLPFPGFTRSMKSDWRFPYQLAVRSAGHLRRIGYSSAVILRPDHWWGAMLAYLAGIPERIGYALPDVASFLSASIEYQQQHTVLQNLQLVQHWTGVVEPQDIEYEFVVDKETDQTYIDGYLSEWGITQQQPIFVIHTGSGTWVKRWEESKWAMVADILAEQLDAVAVLTGSDAELQIAQSIASQMTTPACIIAGDTQLEQLAALLKRALVVIGADSGPLHLAAAVGTPTVALFGPADPIEFSPWGDRERHVVLTSEIGCRPCRILDWGNDNPVFHPCVREITVGRVLEAARRVANR